jgi:hypothetical protein
MMIRTFLLVAALCVCLGSIGLAQEPPPPGPEHKWLHQFVGEWTVSSKALVGPNEPAIEGTGTIKSRMLGDYWVVNEMRAEMQGTTVSAIQTIGYDPAKKKYVGTWVDSMTNYMWRYEGTVDESGKKLNLDADGPNFMAQGKLTRFRDSYEFKAPDHIVATSAMQGEDGAWIVFMTGDMRRK